MKTITTVFTVILALVIFSCNKNPGQKDMKVPQAVKAAFESEHSDVKDAEWEKEGKYYEVEWEVNGKEQEIVYDQDGNIMATEHEITVEELPQAAQDYINENYAGQKVVEAELEETKKGRYYEAELRINGKEVELIFDSNGEYIGEEEEEEDDDDDDDNDDDDDDDDDDD